MKITSLPWEVHYWESAQSVGCEIKADDGSIVIGCMHQDHWEDNARRIVNSCNYHHQLIQYLDTALKLVELKFGNTDEDVSNFIHNAKDLIKKAEGNQ